MFTGIVQHVGEVRAVRAAGGGRRLTIDLGPLAAGLAVGDSVAVAGVCLTAAAPARQGSAAEFDVVPATLDRSNLGTLRAGAKVNLERSLRPDRGLEGHIVQGHADGTAKVSAVRRGADWTVEFACPAELTAAMVPQGSVAVDGVSLTLVDVRRDGFSVALIPTTLEATTLGALAVGDSVNVETDIIGKYVAKMLGKAAPSGGLTIEKLRELGFV
jgi:riboflavin synthase